MITSALIACATAVQGGLTSEVIRTEARWFCIPWERWTFQAFEEGASQHKPILLWNSEFPFGDLTTDQAIRHHNSLAADKRALSAAQKVIAILEVPEIAKVEKVVRKPGAYVFLPDGTLVGSSHGRDIGRWPAIVANATAEMARHSKPYAPAQFEGQVGCFLRFYMSVWCRAKDSKNRSKLGRRRILLGERFFMEDAFVSGRNDKVLARILATQCLVDSTSLNGASWSEDDVIRLVTSRSGPRDLSVEIELESRSSGWSASGRFTFHHPKEATWVRLIGEGSIWKRTSTGKADLKTLEFLGTPDHCLDGSSDDK